MAQGPTSFRIEIQIEVRDLIGQNFFDVKLVNRISQSA